MSKIIDRLCENAELEHQIATHFGTSGNREFEITGGKLVGLKEAQEVLSGEKDRLCENVKGIVYQRVLKHGILGHLFPFYTASRLHIGTQEELEANEGRKIGEKVRTGIFNTTETLIIDQIMGTRTEVLKAFLQRIKARNVS